MIFYNCHRARSRFTAFTARGFTLVEAVCAIALIAVGVASTLGALTKFNSIAAMSRNSTGASALLMNQTDLFQSMGPFNPQKAQIPKDPAYPSSPTYDMTPGTHTLYYKDPTLPLAVAPSTEWPVYREPARWNYDNAAARTGATGFADSDVGQLAYQKDTQTYYRLQTPAPTWTQDDTNGLIVKGAVTCTVTDISPTPGTAPYIYQAVFTITYNYLNHYTGGAFPAYSLSMSVIRTSDI